MQRNLSKQLRLQRQDKPKTIYAFYTDLELETGTTASNHVFFCLNTKY